MDLGLSGLLGQVNLVYLLIAFLVFYYLIAQPFFSLDFFKSVLLFIVLYVLYKKFGNDFFSRFSSFGKRRRH
jgi:uncharacterized membrane protein